MGYSFESRGGRSLLCCDSCGTAGGVRKVPCPAGYCPAVALCAGCRKDPVKKARLAAMHVENDCKGASERFAAKLAAEAAVLATGAYAFCAALNVSGTGGEKVAMTFRNQDGDTKTMIAGVAVYQRCSRTTTFEEAMALAGKRTVEQANAAVAKLGRTKVYA